MEQFDWTEIAGHVGEMLSGMLAEAREVFEASRDYPDAISKVDEDLAKGFTQHILDLASARYVEVKGMTITVSAKGIEVFERAYIHSDLANPDALVRYLNAKGVSIVQDAVYRLINIMEPEQHWASLRVKK